MKSSREIWARSISVISWSTLLLFHPFLAIVRRGSMTLIDSKVIEPHVVIAPGLGSHTLPQQVRRAIVVTGVYLTVCSSVVNSH